MDPKQFSTFRHEAVHELTRLNESCKREFRIGSWPRWDYDLERGTLTFSQEGVPMVIASIHVVGTTSVKSGTWLWAWGNERLPAKVTEAIATVRAFGEEQNLAELTRACAPDDQYLGWEMTAIAAKLLGSKGAYRCPWSNGFLYLVFSSIRYANEKPSTTSEPKSVECTTHGSGFQTFVCEHLISNPGQKWFSQERDDDHRWPDAWCATCDAFFQEEGEWNANNERKTKIKLLCHQCYERLHFHEKVNEARQ